MCTLSPQSGWRITAHNLCEHLLTVTKEAMDTFTSRIYSADRDIVL